MLVIKLWCLPQVGEEKLRAVHKSVVAAAVSVKELGVGREDDIVTLFPTDAMQYGLGAEIIIEVSGLPRAVDQERHPVKQQLAERLGIAVHQHFPDAFVNCFMSSYVESYGFWGSKLRR